MTKAEREQAVGSERDRAIAEAVRNRMVADATTAARGNIVGVRILSATDLDDIIDAVDAQHPAPAPPREVAMRVGRDAWCLGWEAANDNRLASVAMSDALERDGADLAAIVSRHLPTDEEREAADAVVEWSLAQHTAWESGTAEDAAKAAERCDASIRALLAIRAKRGAR